MKQDIQINCQCGAVFTWSIRDQDFFESKGFQAPKRCPKCRMQKNQERDNRSEVRNIGAGPNRGHQGRYSQDDVNNLDYNENDNQY